MLFESEAGSILEYWLVEHGANCQDLVEELRLVNGGLLRSSQLSLISVNLLLLGWLVLLLLSQLLKCTLLGLFLLVGSGDYFTQASHVLFLDLGFTSDLLASLLYVSLPVGNRHLRVIYRCIFHSYLFSQ